MKQASFVLFLAATILAAGCTMKSNPSPTTPAAPNMPINNQQPAAAPAPVQNVTGVLTNVTGAQGAGQATVTVQNQQGQNTTVPVTSNTILFLDGQACTVDQLAALQLTNVSYNCTSVYYMDENGQYVTVGVNVTKIVP